MHDVTNSIPDWEHQKHVEAEDRMRESVHDAYISIAVATLDRMLRRADSVIRVAGAVGTIYTAVLGLVYAYDRNAVFSGWILLPAIMLAISLVLSATYIGYATASTTKFQPLATGLSAELQHRRLSDLMAWVNTIAMRRVWALRTSIVALAIGVGSTPIAYMGHRQSCVGIGAATVFGIWLVYEVVASKKSKGN